MSRRLLFRWPIRVSWPSTGVHRRGSHSPGSGWEKRRGCNKQACCCQPTQRLCVHLQSVPALGRHSPTPYGLKGRTPSRKKRDFLWAPSALCQGACRGEEGDNHISEPLVHSPEKMLLLLLWPLDQLLPVLVLPTFRAKTIYRLFFPVSSSRRNHSAWFRNNWLHCRDENTEDQNSFPRLCSM